MDIDALYANFSAVQAGVRTCLHCGTDISVLSGVKPFQKHWDECHAERVQAVRAAITGTHPFEEAGLGKAPFRLRAVVERRCDGVTVGYAGQPAGCCKYCYQGIAICCVIESADGKLFDVGSDCVRKVYRDDNIPADQLVRTVEDEVKRCKNKARIDRETIRIENAKAELDTCRALGDALSDKPHPVRLQDTLLDSVGYLFKWGGHSGQMRATRIIEKELKELNQGVK
jgi:hypothetical protein